MNSMEVREKFLKFFEDNGHEIVSSSSLIPIQDPTLLFTNAGMNQFKDIFLGKEVRKYKRATSIQKCVRAGGKHNDLDEVGFTNRHLTFFEMMGNFSFGDYFKEGAIKYAWTFLTEEIGLPKEKLHITVYKDDDEAYEIWNKKMGIPKELITRLGEKDNFWQMGETGPCGPCSEIHFDNGKNVGCKSSSCGPDCDCPRFNEVWNLVFMQFDRKADGSLVPLEKKGIDTGMGYERLCMILQNKDSIFKSDIFAPIIKKIEQIAKISYKSSTNRDQVAFHVLCDHVRSTSLLIADGCVPSNEGRGYVLRKIIRRAALFAQKLSSNDKLFPVLANEFIDYFSIIYPELKDGKDLIISLLESEITRFSENLKQGKNIINKYIEENLKKGTRLLTGKQIFKLYDTYGFPVEITRVVANETDMEMDLDGFEQEMKKQKEQSGAKLAKEIDEITVPKGITTKFVGYETLELSSKVNFIHLQGDYYWISTEESPFYVESGGQISDSGWIKVKDHTYPVMSLNKIENLGAFAIVAKIDLSENPEKIGIGDEVKLIVDYYSRQNTTKNHTATHMLQAALNLVVAPTIKQAGSFVNDKYLRFDYTYPEALTSEQIKKIENIVNNKIQEVVNLNIFFTTLKNAENSGVKAIFGEKYNPEEVRVVQIPDFSAELCGGTHVKNTGEIGIFKIESDVALSSGVRRITALTGPECLRLFQQSFSTIKRIGEKFKVKPEGVLSAVENQEQIVSEYLSELKHLKKEMWKIQIPAWRKMVEYTGKIPFLFLELEDYERTHLRMICQEIELKSPGFYFIISKNPKDTKRVNFFAHLSEKWVPEVDLKKFNSFLNEEFGFKGGGNKSQIQGGGQDIEVEYQRKIEDFVREI